MISQDYTKHLADVEEALARVFPSRTDLAWAREVAGQQDLALRTQNLDRINEPGWELLRRGGKRWRPLVMILSHEMFGGSLPALSDLTALVELPHNGSLIVDDIEDKADQRRGGPAIHLVHGIDLAINTGNFLYFEPTYLIERSGLDETLQFRMMKSYLRAMRRLHFGQGLDIVWHNDHEDLPAEEEYLQMCRFKTGALSRLAAELGAVSAGAEEAEGERLGGVWEDIGVGFQILDDVKNLSSGNPGKRRGDDLVEGKKSLPLLLHAARGGQRDLVALLKQISSAADSSVPVEALIDQTIASMEASGALDAAYQKGQALLEGARSRLREWPSGAPRDGMEALIDSFWEGLRR
jgi:octaprenyl-diphosphate synthase